MHYVASVDLRLMGARAWTSIIKELEGLMPCWEGLSTIDKNSRWKPVESWTAFTELEV